MATEPQAAPDADSTIYDLGYQRYEGPRIGRKQAVRSIYIESLRAAFGLGRSARAKIAPWALVFLALIPAIAQLAVGVVLPGDADIEVFAHEDYFSLVQVILVLFVAVVGPDLAGRDQRNHTLSLYFSRAISRADFALAKFTAMTTALLMLTLFPQAVLYIGNAFTVDDFAAYITDEADLILPIIVTSVLAATLLSSISLAVAAHVPHRVFATVAIVLLAFVSGTISLALVELDRPALDIAVYFSPGDIMAGFSSLIFDYDLGDEETLSNVDFPLYTYLVAAIGFTLAFTGLLIRRFESLDA